MATVYYASGVCPLGIHYDLLLGLRNELFKGVKEMTDLTEKQIYDLDNMNVAAQNVALGTLLQELLTRLGTVEQASDGGEN